MATQPQASLLGIPIEIRRQILTLHLKNSKWNCWEYPSDLTIIPRAEFLLEDGDPVAVHHVCRQLHHEVAALAGQLTTLHLDDDDNVYGLVPKELSILPDWYLQVVETLVVDEGLLSLSEIKAMVMRMTALENIEIHFHVESTINEHFTSMGIEAARRALASLKDHQLTEIRNYPGQFLDRLRARLSQETLKYIIHVHYTDERPNGGFDVGHSSGISFVSTSSLFEIEADQIR
jgi:hypothetical protein